ncbi:alpha-L-fucosidase [Chitinophagaceae bacterium MMS25-I14]
MTTVKASFCKLAATAVLLAGTFISFAQQHNYSDNYIAPSDPLVQQKLGHWQDIKFGLLMHWGTYSQWGIVESWSICPEDEDWTQRKGPYGTNYNDYVKAYEQLQTTFNPTDFNPEKWASAAKAAGMQYVVFTTKHHDGFCMFDTKETDYKITSPKTPFSANPRANITKEVLAAFRKEGMMTGTYFSKPDWHCPYYWWPYFPPKDRHVNYDPQKYPERWNQYKTYTFNQIKELMTNYGSVDILWLDGGWVRPSTPEEVKNKTRYNQDIDMRSIAKMAREKQPGLLVVDRTVSGEFENYVTPEQTMPDKPLPYPWESCITMGNSWSYVPGDHYKPANKIVHMLLKIISRGGNLLLNIGPSPKGDWDDTAYARLRDIGAWMKTHSNAVYATTTLAPYEDGNAVFLQSKDGKKQYIYLLSEEGKDDITLPAEITLREYTPVKGAKIVLQENGRKERIEWERSGENTVLHIPAALKQKPAGKYAVLFTVSGS